MKAQDQDWQKKGILKKFEQAEFLGNLTWLETSGFAKYGYYYVPTRCIDGTVTNCKLHVIFHGTGMGYVLNGDSYIYRSGFLQYAASNDLIILAPQMNWSLTNIFGTYDVNVPYRWQYTEPWLGVFTKKEDENIETNKGL